MAKKKEGETEESGGATDRASRPPRRRNNAEIPTKPEEKHDDDGAAREAADDVERGETTPKSEARIFRVTQGPRPLYICAIAIGNVNNQFFTENFGGGKYIAKCFVPARTEKGGWKLTYDRTMHVEIDATVPRKTPPWLLDDAAPAAAARNGDDGDDDDGGDRPRRTSRRATALMDAEVESILEASRRSREQSDAMHQATLTMLTTTMASMAKAARDMMEAKPATPATVATDPIALMDQLEERLERRREKHRDPIERMMQIMEMRMLARELGDSVKDGKDDDDEENPFKTVAREMGRGFGEILKPHIAKLTNIDTIEATPVDGAAAAATPPETGADGSARPASSPRTENTNTTMVKMFLASIRSAIKRKTPPDEYAVSLLQMIPAEYGPDVESSLAGEGALEKIYAIAPDLREHDEWMKAVAAEVVRQFDENEKENAGGGDKAP